MSEATQTTAIKQAASNSVAEAISIMDPEVLCIANQQISRIQPIVKSHGGAVEVLSATKDKLVIAVKGHCAGCAMVPITYGMVLTKYIKQALPQIKDIKYLEIKDS